MAAIKLKDYWSNIVFLKQTPSNTVANKIQFLNESRQLIYGRGFLGIKDLNSDSLIGGICWGSGDPNAGGNLQGIVFEITLLPRKVKIDLLDSPSSISDDRCDKIIESFFHSIEKKVHEKMVKHLKGTGSGGSYTGRRMEGHRRGNQITNGDFFDTEKDNLFTDKFIKTARNLTITYR